MPKSPSGRFICELCGGRFDESGDCVDHPDEPLQDLGDEDVRIMLDNFDSGRKRKRLGLLGIVGFVVCSPLVVVIPLRKIAVLAWIGCSAALAGGLYKLFPARAVMPDLEKENPAWA